MTKLINQKMRLNALIFLIALAASAAVIECACRLVKVNFEKYNYNPVPIFYRMPTVEVGDVFFRRPGPDSWRGKVIRSAMRYFRYREADTAYPDETSLTVTYDGFGFRNPEGLEDYEIAVTGDSCTELGYLDYEDLFSTRVGRISGSRVKNLGVSSTSSLTQACYLREYGRSRSMEHAVMVFFEGNDLEEGVQEMKELEVFKATGRRPERRLRNNSSFIWAVGRFMKRSLLSFGPRRSCANAYLETGTARVPVTIFYAPPSGSQLTEEERAFLDAAFREWARAAEEIGAKPWIVYMPCKHRVFYGRLQFMKNAGNKLAGWKPTDLPDVVGEYAAKYRIRFVDATPALVSETEKSEVVFNTLFDSHINSRGSAVVAGVIADALKPYRWGRKAA